LCLFRDQQSGGGMGGRFGFVHYTRHSADDVNPAGTGLFHGYVGMILITMPIFMPVINSMGIDPIYFGIMS